MDSRVGKSRNRLLIDGHRDTGRWYGDYSHRDRYRFGSDGTGRPRGAADDIPDHCRNYRRGWLEPAVDTDPRHDACGFARPDGTTQRFRSLDSAGLAYR